MRIFFDRFSSPIGPLAIARDEEGKLVRLEFDAPAALTEFRTTLAAIGDVTLEASAKECAPVRTQLEEYFGRERKRFDLPLRLIGTEFQQRVWRELIRIPYGRTRSYAEIAERIGSARAFRAVGQANHHNPCPLVIPCHRVVGADGSLTGFGGGIPVKRALLDLEQGVGTMDELFSK